MTVYVDLLLAENTMMNYVILSTTAFFAKKKISFRRLLIGSLLSSLYVFLAFFPEFKSYFSIFCKFFFSMVIIAITFWENKFIEFFKVLGLFYLSSFLFGGIAFFIIFFTNSEIVFYNGIPYITNYSLFKTLMLTVCLGYIGIKLCFKLIMSRINKGNISVLIDINFDGKNSIVEGILDTGNSLRDPINHFPVIVVEYESIKDLLPPELDEDFFERCDIDSYMVLQVLEKSSLLSRFRLVPFSSLGKQNGMLIGFKPDKVDVIKDSKIKEFNDVIVGIYTKKLSVDSSYRALVGLEVY